MKKPIPFVLIILLFSFSVSLFSQDDASKARSDRLMADYARLALPDEEHEILKGMAGSWDLEIKYWSKPDSIPLISAGTSENKMILGNRFLECSSQSGHGLSAMEALIIMGYDRRNEQYTYMGFDSWGTYYVTANGTYNDKKSTLTMYGEDYDPIMHFIQKYDVVLTFIDDDKFSSELIFKNPELTGGADQFKMVEVIYTRKNQEMEEIE